MATKVIVITSYSIHYTKLYEIKLKDPFIIEWDPPKALIFESDNSTTMDENYTAEEDILGAYFMAEFWIGEIV